MFKASDFFLFFDNFLKLPEVWETPDFTYPHGVLVEVRWWETQLQRILEFLLKSQVLQ